MFVVGVVLELVIVGLGGGLVDPPELSLVKVRARLVTSTQNVQ